MQEGENNSHFDIFKYGGQKAKTQMIEKWFPFFN